MFGVAVAQEAEQVTQQQEDPWFRSLVPIPGSYPWFPRLHLACRSILEQDTEPLLSMSRSASAVSE